MEKDGEMTAREAFQNGVYLVCFSITVSFWALDTIYEMDKMEDYLDTRHLLTDRVLLVLHLGQDWKSERASGFCFFLLFSF
ncbi:uncharacterized protein TRIVIDRAFT_215549 [Trichoderma virens Gv29-8]|uniref:Uncharacterized protein n=1 Tax=Hypocrea virens (strain Gv29-8 / FGSC 10586) TaxID=413071 RepID=G9MLN1_HYPVG|nr:uncharacterized protein TRIVIDRAFT_215549 [Trichoderma virens Gv29-8]EHK24258.1 hypothetical protein TRIVIDRAFT_215549 [Trichoderma virens Gv29-8]